MADLYFRSGEYAKGLAAIHIVLQLNGYDEAANFMAGNLYRAMGDFTNAREAFGWAARSMEFRSASFTQMAELSLIQSQFELAKEYAHKALDFNRYNINALQTLAIAERMSGNNQEAKKPLHQLIEIDPLHHFANLEVYFLNPSKKNWDHFIGLIHNEYPDQTHLELAIAYHNRGQDEVAVQLLEKLMDTSQNPIIHLWHAYLNNDAELLNVANGISPEFVFPYRRETIQTLVWATKNNSDWKWTYYLALNLWAKDQNAEALALMNSLGERPDYGPFYIARASLKEKLGKSGIDSDLEKSIQLRPESWLIQLDAVRYYQHHKKWEKAYQLSLNAFMHFRNNFNVEIMHARSLLYMGRVDECLVVLESVNVLPSEMAKESRQLYKWAFLRQSIDLIKAGKVEEAISAINASKEWPENLGAGKPYQPDERIQNILLDYVKGIINSNQYLVLLEALNDEKSGQGYDSILIKEALALIQK
jgi:tetratricopeptide (TPR) repeat protein